MFTEPEDLEKALYPHIIAEIIGENTAAMSTAISAGEQEVAAYLAQRYDVEDIFSKEGDERNAMVLEHCITVAVWHLLKLCYAETLYDMWHDRYREVVRFLEGVADGSIAPRLPLLTDGQGNTFSKVQVTSTPKFRHSW
jgi:phage gp36-like protein